MQPCTALRRRRLLLGTGAFALALTGASANAQLLVPFGPTARVQQVFDTVDEWVEVYALRRSQWPAAIETLRAGHAPETAALAYVLDARLHLHWAGSAQEWAEQESSSVRDGRPVEYDDPCKDYPRPGDRLTWRFEGPGSLQAVFALEVLRYLPYATHPLTGAPRVLDPANKVDCPQQEGARIFLGGSLSVQQRQQELERREVLVQSIYEP